MKLALLIALVVATGTIKNAVAHEPQKSIYPNGAKYAISLSFDDARASQIDNGVGLLNKHKVKASFYLMPYHMQQREDKWRAVAEAGHEIANHSTSHLCTGNFRWLRAQNKGLEQVDLAFIEQDIASANEYIEQHTGVKPTGFAYPCGQTFVGRADNVKSYVPVIAKHFHHGRTWNDETANDPYYVDLAQVRAMRMDGQSFVELKALLENAKFENAWIVLAGHEVGEKGLYTVDSKALEQLIIYLKDPANGYWLAPVGEVARLVDSLN